LSFAKPLCGENATLTHVARPDFGRYTRLALWAPAEMLASPAPGAALQILLLGGRNA